ncbi:tyrosine-protein kinase family protein [Mucilaginibacter sp. UR6-11]|uniref:GumC family protein n=1 Tax=Mucilaginibacter sp. UR6-11 TaxID=1435644 RepID=UPI001E63172F|nr:tyrosine-protein kinase family protein [Mucilaginibacter sp. UR6-11]MCC8426380.1 AAA family ATPase [Mucilaginibacter sp. UR6-11]
MDTKFVLNPANRPDNLKERTMPYLKKWYWFLTALVLCLGCVWFYLKNATPIYKVTSTLLVLDDKKGDGLLKSTAFSDLDMFHETRMGENEIEILRSKDLIYNSLSKLNLATRYFIKNGLKTEELYKSQTPFAVSIIKLEKPAYKKELGLQSLSDSTFLLTEGNRSWRYKYGQPILHTDYKFIVNKGLAPSDSHKAVSILFNDVNQMAASYSAGLLKVNPVMKESNTLNLSLNDAIPLRGVDILTSIINTYNFENVQKKNIMAVNTIVFIDKRLKTLEQELSATEGDIEKYKQQNSAIDATAGTQINLEKSAEYGQLLEASNVQMNIVNSLSAYLSNTNNQFAVIPSTMGLKDPVLNTLIGRFNDLQIERNRMLHSANLSNPLVQNLSDQISSLRSNIMENLGNIKKGFLIENDQLKKNSAQYTSRIQSVPALERGLLQRSREQIVKTNLYQYLLQKREETALSLSATVQTSQLVDKPSYDADPEYPKAGLLYLYGSILGLIAPAFLIYGGNKLNSKVKNTGDLKMLNGIKILGELPHHNLKNTIAIQSGDTSTITELFRYIRTNLGFLNEHSQNKIMLVTSCMKGEGKTFFSINLGLTLSLLNKRVLIMEFDLRNPDLLSKMGLSQQRGIADYLEYNIDELNIQPYDKAPNLYVLGCGITLENPAELLTSKRVDQLFQLLAPKFDYIIVDTSPVGAVADAFSLAKHADLSIYLVRYNYTNTEQLDILNDVHENNKLKNVMVVLNDAKSDNRSIYAYGRYGYSA